MCWNLKIFELRHQLSSLCASVNKINTRRYCSKENLFHINYCDAANKKFYIDLNNRLPIFKESYLNGLAIENRKQDNYILNRTDYWSKFIVKITSYSYSRDYLTVRVDNHDIHIKLFTEDYGSYWLLYLNNLRFIEPFPLNVCT